MTIDMSSFETITLNCDIPNCEESADWGGNYICGCHPAFLLCDGHEVALHQLVEDEELVCSKCEKLSVYTVYELTDDN